MLETLNKVRCHLLNQLGQSQHGHMLRFSKCGSEMIEAALVFPIVILSAVTLLYLMISLYNEADAKAQVQIMLMKEAGSGTYGSETYEALYSPGFSGSRLDSSSKESSGIKPQHQWGLTNERLTADFSSLYEAHGLAGTVLRRNWHEEISIIDEVEFIRCLDIGSWALRGSS